MINLSLSATSWVVRSETGDFYLTVLFAAAPPAELIYWCLYLPLRYCACLQAPGHSSHLALRSGPTASVPSTLARRCSLSPSG